MGAEKWNELGLVHAGWAEWAAAQECFEAAITAEPGWAAVWANLALAAARTGDISTAEGALEMADTLEPERAGQWRRVMASGRPLPIGRLRFAAEASS